MTDGRHRGFRRGYNMVTIGQQNELRWKLRNLIGGKTRAKLYYWMTGATIIQPEMSREIEHIFAKYGIEPKDVWDE